MSSATRVDPYAARKIQETTADKFLENSRRLGMSPRQQHLNYLYSRYTCTMYDARRFDFDGGEHSDPIAAEAIGQAGFLPPGYYDAGQTMPIKFRRPSTPYYLDKVVTDRFTSLLFSARKHPKLRVEDDPEAERQIARLIEASRLWPAFMKARTLGGAMGTVAVGFAFHKGKPVIEVHDPRWLFPVFADRATFELHLLEKRYQFPKEERDPETGRWVERWYWYRRVISDRKDTLYRQCLVTADEPEWTVQREVEHGFDFCPVMWIQNLPVLDQDDGEHDCHGMMDISDEIDRHLSAASRGTLFNCDPTLFIASDSSLDQINKGSDNAIKLEKGASVQYVELNGSGPKTSLEMADRLRDLALEISQCVLDRPDAPSSRRTATEIEHTYASMLAKADILREQYGERGIKPLVEMMVRAAKTLGMPRIVNNETTRSEVKVDLSAVEPETEIALQWGAYFEPDTQDAMVATQAASAAKAGGLIDDEHAINHVAPYFGVENPSALVKKMADAAGAAQPPGGGGYDPFASMFGDQGGGAPPPAEPPKTPGA